jgi:hypothetical protein
MDTKRLQIYNRIYGQDHHVIFGWADQSLLHKARVLQAFTGQVDELPERMGQESKVPKMPGILLDSLEARKRQPEGICMLELRMDAVRE